MTSYLVLGGGISGLTAADDILRADPDAEVTVVEGGDRVGGKLRGADVGGAVLDVGAEAFLVRRPEAVELAGRAGLEEELVHPTAARAQVWSRGALHPVPARTVMGVPADPDDLAGLLTPEEVERARAEVVRATPPGDVSVSDLVGSRLGAAVVQRLVEPLLGGVYAGHASLLSAAASLPALLAAAHEGVSVLGTAGRLAPLPPAVVPGAPAPPRRPVFATVRGGLHRLPAALAGRLAARGVTVLTGTLARELHREDGGWTVVTGPRPSPRALHADRLVLALPPAPAARLLAGVAPQASRLLGEVETASVAVLTLALPAARLGDLGASGFLVPPVDGRVVKASTFSAAKWDWVAEAGRGAAPDGGDLTYLRLSVGRHREEASLQVDDAELLLAARAELAQALGREVPDPVATHVQRWGGALPQYAVGHLERVAAVREDLSAVPGLVACGAAFDGVGIPACIASAHRAVAELLA